MKIFQSYYDQVKNIIKKIHPNYNEKIINSTAQKIINIWPIELEQNFFEWINEEPLSEIKIYDLSINDFFRVWNQSIYNYTYTDIKLALTHINYYMTVSEDRRESCKDTLLNIYKMHIL